MSYTDTYFSLICNWCLENKSCYSQFLSLKQFNIFKENIYFISESKIPLTKYVPFFLTSWEFYSASSLTSIMEKVAQQELCLLFALIDITGRGCSELQAFEVAILKGNIYRVALSDREKTFNIKFLMFFPFIPFYFYCGFIWQCKINK